VSDADDDHSGNLQTRESARQVFLDVAAGSSGTEQDIMNVSRLCDEQILKSVIDIAWRHQFDPDRYAFKRAIRELEEYVVQRWRATRGEPLGA
jgi:hypothetical protein